VARASTPLHLFAERLKRGAIPALPSGQLQGQGRTGTSPDDLPLAG